MGIKFDGTIYVDDAEIRELLVGILSHRYGVSVNPADIQFAQDAGGFGATCKLTSIKTRA